LIPGYNESRSYPNERLQKNTKLLNAMKRNSKPQANEGNKAQKRVVSDQNHGKHAKGTKNDGWNAESADKIA
jgi:hypothetical protein